MEDPSVLERASGIETSKITATAAFQPRGKDVQAPVRRVAETSSGK
jgi:hypothetical protein